MPAAARPVPPSTIGRLIAGAARACLVASAAPLLVLQAQDAGRTGLIDGRVRAAQTQQPVASATITVGGTTLSVATGEDGRFRLRAPAGVVRLEVRAIGFAPIVRSDVVVSAGKPTTLVIELQPRVVQLATVEVAPSYFEPARATPVSTQRFSAEEVRRTPGVQEDVVRAVSVLPGVGVTTAGRNDLVVRGGAPFENLFVVDNVEVPNVNHFGTQGSTGGPVSLIPIEFVQDAALSAGGFGVRYGDRTSSVTTITLREGNRARRATTLNLSATGLGAIAEGPLPHDGSLLVSARRSYLDFVFNAAGFPFIPSYTDVTLKLVQRPSARDEVSLLVIGARDRIRFSNATADDRYDNSTVLGSSQDQYVAGLTWKRLLPRGVLLTTLGRTYSRFDAAQRDSSDPPQLIFGARSTEGESSLRSDLTLQLNARTELTAGAIVKYASALDYDITLPGALRRDAAGVARPLRVDTSFTAWRQAAYAQASVEVNDRLRLTLGARADHYGFLAATRVAPRAALAWSVGGSSTLTLVGGRYYQAPQPTWLVGDPANVDRLQPLRADQVVAGWQRLLRPDVKVQVEGYVKSYADYPGRVFRPRAVLQPSGYDDVTNDIPYGLEPLVAGATGQVRGVEVLLQKRLSEVPVYGLVSASYNRTRFTGLDGIESIGAFDSPMVFNALLGWRPNPRWEYSGRIRSAAGLPTTPFTAGGTLDFTRYNAGERLPVFFALDLRIDRRFSFRRSQLVTYIDVQNATARKNVSQVAWDARLRAPKANESIGVLPSIGINWEF
ncbi:MAG: TonB-dependent receptor [Gemmatimonadaceae bacterium]|nr:TonB-dependent receptor [Gemmatimonadaceae bacterium]